MPLSPRLEESGCQASSTIYMAMPRIRLLWPCSSLMSLIELFLNKRQGKLSSKKAMEGANRWVYSSETTVR
jgi:hypothetical protein